MSENQETPPEEEEERKTHPAYVPAEDDSWLSVKFAGNSAHIVDVALHNATPFHILAAAAYLKEKALQMINQAEAAEYQRLQEHERLNKIEIAKSSIKQ